jgi:hypothetical protein
MPTVPVIAQKQPTIPDINAASRAEMTLFGSAAPLGQRAANPKICCPSRLHAQQIVWLFAGFSDLPLCNFDDL